MDRPDADPGSAPEQQPRAGDATPSPVQFEWPEKPAGDPPPKESKLGIFKELPFLILIAFGLALLIKTFLIQAFYIPSESMVPTLLVKDRVLVNRLVYRFRGPRRGEIIVFIAERDDRPRSTMQKVRDFLTEGLGVSQPAERDFIKRVIGLPNETIEYRDGKITITRTNGEVLTLPEPYARIDRQPFGPFKVPADHYFVMGDNRPNSSDSRSSLGPVARSDIIGKAFVRIWPPSRFHVFKRPDYRAEPASEEGAAAAVSGAGPPVAIALAVGSVRLRRRRRRAA